MNIPQWMISTSICLNNLTGGPEGWSLCARFYRDRLDGKKTGLVLSKLSDLVFSPFEKQHCRKAYLLRNK